MRKLLVLFAAAIAFALPAKAQNNDQPLVFSQTVIAIVPGNTVPKAVTQSPQLTTPQADAEKKPDTDELTEAMLPSAEPETLTLRVKVRGSQIPLDQGMYQNYQLDEEHGVLTYFPTAEPRDFIAENIHQPLDILFIGDDGIVAQIVPEVVPAYLQAELSVDFPLRALLFMQGGLAAKWGVQPGYRIEHGMFNPKPLIYKAS